MAWSPESQSLDYHLLPWFFSHRVSNVYAIGVYRPIHADADFLLSYLRRGLDCSHGNASYITGAIRCTPRARVLAFSLEGEQTTCDSRLSNGTWKNSLR